MNSRNQVYLYKGTAVAFLGSWPFLPSAPCLCIEGCPHPPSSTGHMTFAMRHVFLMSQDSLSDPSKRPQIQDIYKIYQIYLLQQGTVHQFQSQGTAASGFQRPVSMTLSLFHFVFGTSMEENNPFQSLETSTSFPWFGRI